MIKCLYLLSGDEAEDFAVIEEITGKISGEQMLLTTLIYRGVPKVDAQIDPVWDAATGLANITRGDLIFEESMYVSVLPGSGILPKPGEYVPREFTATSATTNALGVGAHASGPPCIRGILAK